MVVRVMAVLTTLLIAGCTAASPPAEEPAAGTAATEFTSEVAVPVPTVAEDTSPALATPAAPAVDPLAFLRAQQSACAAHAATTGNPVAEPDRFSGATVVRALGDGAYLVRDGRGTELVVDPAKGVVLPPSGRADDLMPAPYGFGCPESVFVGTAD
jgi:hypothetical protein